MKKFFILLLVIILFTIIIFDFYIFFFKEGTRNLTLSEKFGWNFNSKTESEEILDNTTETTEENSDEEDETETETETETESESELEEITNETEEVENTTTETEEEVVEENPEIDLSEIQNLLIMYGPAINRVTLEETTNLESNTVLLQIANTYFNKQSTAKKSLTVDSKYAATVSNINKFIKELTGLDYSSYENIESYDNYIGYNSKTKTYATGADISKLTCETYECPSSSLELTNSDTDNNQYTIKGQLIRVYNNTVETTYTITLNVKINNSYKYQKYQILSLTAISKTLPDDTVHLVSE